MATIETEKITFEPDMDLILKQCDQVVQRDASLAKKITAALKSFDDARAYVDSGDAPEALEKLVEAVEVVFNMGADELEASCFFYMGFIALAAGNDEPGLNMLNSALYKTQNPWLALCTYNRLMVYHLTNENYDSVMNLANATKKVVSSLPGSDAGVYFSAGASYSLAEAHFRQGKFPEVLPDIKEAMKGFQNLSMKAETAKCQGMLGNSLISMGELKSGLEYVERSLKLFREMNNEGEIAFLLQGRGLAMAKMGNKADAIRDHREALKLFKQRGEVKAINSTLAILANLEAE